MPDNLDELATGLARDLTAVRWPEPGQIRARARRRAARNGVVIPFAVILVVAAVAWTLRTGIASTLSTGPAAGPPMRPATTDAAPPPADDGTSIPIEALLQPEDVGPARHLDNVHTWLPGTYPTWTFNHELCPALAGLKLTAFRAYQFRRIHQVVPDRPEDFNLLTVFVEAERYPGDTARTVMNDVRRVVAACARFDAGPSEASTLQRPAHAEHRLTLLDQGFAGTDSLFVRHEVVSVADRTGQPFGDPTVMIYMVIRVDDLVTIVGRYTEDHLALKALATRATARLCLAANPRC